jgi:tether containing UBX domain for GLUT4
MLTVLCTNGRRQQVKVQPNTKILEVIEEVCKKQGLNSNEYELVHHKKPVDIALSIRLSGVPNNAQLELRRSESGPRVYENVTLALQLDDGTRLEPLTFKPDTTSLLNVVEAYMDLPSTAAKCDYMKAVLDELTATRRGSYPTFSYLNEQIVGLYQIKNTTLKDMGLTHGRVIVRFSFRQIDGEQIAKMNDDFRAKLQKNAKLDEIFQKQVEEQKREEEERKKEEMKMSSSLVSLTESMVQESVAPLQQPPAPTPQPVAALQPSQLPQPQQAAEPFRPPRAIDRVQQQRPFDMDYEFVSSSSSSNKPNEFANFKFPEETKGQDLNNMNELAEIERESKRPCERKAILIYADREEFADVASATAREATTSQQADEPIDDDFYKVTIVIMTNFFF